VAGLHTPVLVDEILRWLQIRADGIYVDATTGTGGHAVEIAKQLGAGGRLVGIDRDAQALEIARERLKPYGERVTLVQGNFSGIGEIAARLKIPSVDGIVADLGVSSLQLDTMDRGFSFRGAGPLDMRMDRGAGETAAEIVNHWPERDLANLLYQLGEERDSRRIARSIVRQRPIRDTEHLATVVAGAQKRGRQRLHPATKTFLALRLAVNRELEELEQFLDQAPATLSSGGRLAILSYHSLEDRRVKHTFRRLAQEGILNVLTKKVIEPTEAEVAANPRARSARLRVAERRPAPSERS
jgi:16S rRNA (cytosine1402-N4)-methyltransferase